MVSCEAVTGCLGVDGRTETPTYTKQYKRRHLTKIQNQIKHLKAYHIQMYKTQYYYMPNYFKFVLKIQDNINQI